MCTLLGCKTQGLDKKYTVTKEQWEQFYNELNFTLELKLDGEFVSIQKYTKEAMKIKDSITIFNGDNQFTIYNTEYGWVAYDETYLDLWHGGLLEGKLFEDFEYDKNRQLYVYTFETQDLITEYTLKFEDGFPVCFTITDTDNSTTPATVTYRQTYYSNIGTTVIEIPEYIFEEELLSKIVATVTEEQWNYYKEENNFTVNRHMFNKGELSSNIQKTTNEAIELDGKIIIVKDSKKYILEQNNNVWYAKEYLDSVIWEGPLLKNFDFNDFEYDEERRIYVQKTSSEDVWKYSVAFENGVITSIYKESITDSSNMDDLVVIS